MLNLVPRDVAAIAPTDLSPSALAAWFVSDEGYRQPAVCEWLAFLTVHHSIFTTIYEPFKRANPGVTGRKDVVTAATSPMELLAIANHLYILYSHGITGTVLECGCYKGFSSSCVSYACERLGYPLVVADSFAGLPPLPGEVGEDMYYQAGDFAGSRTEVERNVRTFGRIKAVEFIEGWFSNSLLGWNRPLALIWMDVDLDQSAVDVIRPCLPHLDPRGVVYSHEFDERFVFNGRINEPCGPPGIIVRAIEKLDPTYRAKFLLHNTGLVGRSTSVGMDSFDLLMQVVPHIAPSTPIPTTARPRHWLSRLVRRAA